MTKYAWIWAHLLKKLLMENFSFCAVMAKEPFYEWCERKNKQCCYNRLILENSIKITKSKDYGTKNR